MQSTTTLAAPENMRAVIERGITGAVHVVAVSLKTGEEYSATPGDYFMQPDNEPLRDELGEPMVLAYRVCHLVDALTDAEIYGENRA